MKIIPFIVLAGIVTSCSDPTPPQQTSTSEKNVSSKIVGRWKTIDSEIIPFGHISYCENLRLNSVFEFKDDGKLGVYINEKALTPCNGEQTYKMRGKQLQIVEDDMIFDYVVPKLTVDSLVLIIKHIPIDMLRNMDISENQLQHIKKNGFQLTLLKTD